MEAGLRPLPDEPEAVKDTRLSRSLVDVVERRGTMEAIELAM